MPVKKKAKSRKADIFAKSGIAKSIKNRRDAPLRAGRKAMDPTKKKAAKKKARKISKKNMSPYSKGFYK